MLNSPYNFGTTARTDSRILCHLIAIEVCELNGQALTQNIAHDLLYRFWIALGFDPWNLVCKHSEVCFLYDMLITSKNC